jgi:hypothetical protein
MGVKSKAKLSTDHIPVLYSKGKRLAGALMIHV